MQQSGTVKSLSNGIVLVELDPPTGCSRCSSGVGCGAGLFARLLCSGVRPVRLESALPHDLVIGARVGDRVSVELPDRWLLLVALGGFFLPILLLVSLLVVGHWCAAMMGFNPDAGAATAGLSAILIIIALRSSPTRGRRWDRRWESLIRKPGEMVIARPLSVSSGTVIARSDAVSGKTFQKRTLEQKQ